MGKVTDRILWSILVLAIGVSLFIFVKPAFSNIVHASMKQLSHATDTVDASSNSDFSYNLNTTDDTASIKGYSGHIENLVIPQYRKVGSVYYKVTAISHNAFYENTSIKQVTIPDGVCSIGSGAFRHDYNLKYVILGSDVTSIGGWAFQNTALTRIDFPDRLTSISEWAFQNTSLTSVDFPASLTSIGGHAFTSSSLSAISFKKPVDLGDGAFTNTKLTNVTLPTGSTYNTDTGLDANNYPTQTFDPGVNVTFD